MEEDIYVNLRLGVDEIKDGYSIVAKMITPEEVQDMYGFINYLQMHPKVYERYADNKEKYRKMKLY